MLGAQQGPPQGLGGHLEPSSEQVKSVKRVDRGVVKVVKVKGEGQGNFLYSLFCIKQLPLISSIGLPMRGEEAAQVRPMPCQCCTCRDLNGNLEAMREHLDAVREYNRQYRHQSGRTTELQSDHWAPRAVTVPMPPGTLPSATNRVTMTSDNAGDYSHH